ncbi:MAG: glycosyltransferase family 39 protein, partial [Chloroflexota bacterium]
MKRISRQTFLAILLTLLAFAVRAHNLGGDSLWIDELITLWDSIQGWQWMLRIEDHPPLLYILTWFSVSVFGESEFTLRLPSLFAGVLSAPLIYTLARHFGYGRAGLVAMLLLALSPFHLHYSQEARHYALLMTLSLASFLWLHRAMSRSTLAAWLGYGGLTALNLYTHYAALVVLGAQALLIAGWSLREIARRQPRRLLLPATGAFTVLVLYGPWLPRLWQAMQRNVAGQRDTVANRGSPFSAWVMETVRALGGNDQFYAILLSLLALAGLFLLLRRGAWRDL